MAGMEAGSVDAVVTDPPYGLEFMGKEWDRLDWRDGGGMSKPGIGERSTAWVSYGGETANATCATCGGRMRGAKKCQCESPDWRVKGEPYLPRTAERARQMQDWHHAWAVAALRVLKPSHYLLAFGGTRTWHHLACALEDAGFEIRDTLMWLYGSGFPKGKACLKPAWEPVILARKPGPMRELGIEECRIATSESGSRNHHGAVYNGVADGYQRPGKSCYTHKTDWEMQPAGRWPANLVLDEEAGRELDGAVGERPAGVAVRSRSGGKTFGTDRDKPPMDDMTYSDSGGPSRFYFIAKGDPCDANTAGMSSCPLSGLDASALSDALTLAARVASEQAAAGREATAACTSSCSGCTQTPNPALCAAILASIGTIQTTTSPSKSCGSVARATDAPTNSASAGRVAVDSDQESVTRFLYCAKASRKERNEGCGGMEARAYALNRPQQSGTLDDRYALTNKNHHPTVKPVALMRWLVRLVARPGDVVLDPFAGSGTTGVACIEEGRDFIGIEKEAEYVEIARRRIEAAAAQERLPV